MYKCRFKKKMDLVQFTISANIISHIINKLAPLIETIFFQWATAELKFLLIRKHLPMKAIITYTEPNNK